MSILSVRPKEECKWDAVALGEVMLRFDPGEGRVRTTRQFSVWEGGGEYNVMRGLRKCFGLRTTIVTAIVDNEVGRLLEDLIMQGGVDMSHVQWAPFDGVGRTVRNGLNFTERGFGVRAACGCSDRGHSAVSQLKPGDVDWSDIFEREGSRWFHCGGIFSALSETTSQIAGEAMQAARKAGSVVSYDLNYRESLWKDNGGQEKAREVNRALAPFVDVMLGNEEDFGAALGFEIQGLDENLSKLDPAKFKAMMEQVVREYPNIRVVATTLRNAKTASRNDWGAVMYSDGDFYEAFQRPDLEILDRVGGGDSFVSGLIYGILAGKGPDECVNYGAAHGALAMTTPGDTSMATLEDVERVVRGGSTRVKR
jgi:2-dehydro-3-deoxygluconokinase